MLQKFFKTLSWLELSFEQEISNIYAKANSCDSEFQSAMSSIHETYDSSLVVCAAIGLFAGGGPGILCVGVATVVAISQTAVAIDTHTNCVNGAKSDVNDVSSE